MIIATLFTLLLSLPIQATPPAAGQGTPQGKISGRVVAADSGKPIAGAAVRAVSFEVMRVAKTELTGGGTVVRLSPRGAVAWQEWFTEPDRLQEALEAVGLAE